MRERTPQHGDQVSRLGDAIDTLGVKTVARASRVQSLWRLMTPVSRPS